MESSKVVIRSGKLIIRVNESRGYGIEYVTSTTKSDKTDRIKIKVMGVPGKLCIDVVNKILNRLQIEYKFDHTLKSIELETISSVTDMKNMRRFKFRPIKAIDSIIKK